MSKAAKLQESLIATGFPSQKRHESPNVHFYQEFTLRSHGVRRAGSAAIDLAYVACGRLEGFWEFKLNPWDTSAGFLMVEEAGGKITHFDGGKFTLDSREVFATNGLIHAEMQGLFEDMFAGRNLGAIPTPAEFAARRKAGAGGDSSTKKRRIGIWIILLFAGAANVVHCRQYKSDNGVEAVTMLLATVLAFAFGFVLHSAKAKVEQMRLRRSARVFLFDEHGDLLLIRFVAQRTDGPFVCWVTPGGEVEKGEADLAAAERELAEELGLRAAAGGAGA